jgi:hypothetical protein
VEPINTWVEKYPNYAALMQFYEKAAITQRTKPAVTFITCRVEVRFAAMESL